SRQIAEALEVELTDRDQSRLGRGVRRGGAAAEHYLEGRVHLLRQTVKDVNAAVECFERACAADPDFSLAWAGLADAHLHMAFSFDPDGGWYRRAEDEAAKALALDPNLPEARYVRGRLIWTPQGGFKHADAMAEIQRGRRDAADRTIELAWRQFPDDILFYPLRGLSAALRGDAAGADEHIGTTVRNAKSFGHYHHAQYDVACIHAVLGRTDQ